MRGTWRRDWNLEALVELLANDWLVFRRCHRYLIRLVIRMVKARASDTWPVVKGTVSTSNCPPASYGGPVAEVVYTYIHEGSYFSAIHRKPFLLHASAQDYAAQFPTGSDIIARVKPGQPETSIVCDVDQAPARLGGG